MPRRRVFTAIGGLLLFLSWIAGSYFLDLWREEQTRLQYGAGFASANMSLTTQYMLLLSQEQLKSSPNQEVLFNAASGFLVHAYDDLMALEIYLREDNNPTSAHEEEYRKRLDQVLALSRNRDLPRLLAEAHTLQFTYTRDGNTDRLRLLERYQAVARHTDPWKKRFQLLYASGALFMAIGFWKNET